MCLRAIGIFVYYVLYLYVLRTANRLKTVKNAYQKVCEGSPTFIGMFWYTVRLGNIQTDIQTDI